jgi:hypothetical protein
MGGSAAEAAGEAEIGVVVLGAERLVCTVSSRAGAPDHGARAKMVRRQGARGGGGGVGGGPEGRR